MPRILRNYLISFLIIGFFLLAVHLIDRWAGGREGRSPATPAPAVTAPGTGAPAVPAPTQLH